MKKVHIKQSYRSEKLKVLLLKYNLDFKVVNIHTTFLNFDKTIKGLFHEKILMFTFEFNPS
jgi:hypothetical protein